MALSSPSQAQSSHLAVGLLVTMQSYKTMMSYYPCHNCVNLFVLSVF